MGRAAKATGKRRSAKPQVAPIPHAHGNLSRHWRQNLPIIRFVVLFAVLLGAFQIAYHEFVISSSTFQRYLADSSSVAASLLRLVGEPVTATGDTLVSDFSMSIRRGCDGLQTMSILVIAVLVFPCGIVRKSIGVGVGIVLLLILNILRIASLFWAGVHLPGLFQSLHVHVWPALLILSAMIFWLTWATWATRPLAVD